jgi:hypothetical protein
MESITKTNSQLTHRIVKNTVTTDLEIVSKTELWLTHGNVNEN